MPIWSGLLDDGFVYEEDWNAISNRVNTSAFSALQTLPLVLKHQALLAERANQNFE
jgi:hypothetical protein